MLCSVLSARRGVPIVRALLAALVLCCTASPAVAMSYLMMRDEPLVDQAHGIVVAEVVQVEPATLAFQNETVYLLAIERSLSPRRTRAYERMALPGSPPDTLAGYRPFGVPRLEPGDRLLVPFERRLDGTIVPLQLTLGLFFERVVEGRAYYMRVLEPAGDLGKGRNGAFHAARDATRFEQWIAARASGRARTVDYLVPDLVEQQSKFNLTRANDTFFIRWFDFDASTTVNWRAVAAGQTGMVTDEFLQFQQALAAWTNHGGSTILLGYSGTQAGTDTHCDDGTSDGNVVLWNDPFMSIGGTFTCPGSGTLAVAGPCFFGNTMQHNGVPFHPAFEARLTVQDGAGCFFDGNAGANGAQVLTHEIGHTLGFGHSCGDGGSGACVGGSPADQATMRALAHNDARGAVLGTDDQAAAAFSYLDAAGADPGAIFKDAFEN